MRVDVNHAICNVEVTDYGQTGCATSMMPRGARGTAGASSERAGRDLLLLHGFTGSVATWAPFLAEFARGGRAIAVDLPGHGGTSTRLDHDNESHGSRLEPLSPRGDRTASCFTMDQCVSDLLAVLDTLEAPAVTVLGYSMGGRVALHLAARAPQRVAGLILESASPGLATIAERQARMATDEALATLIEHDGLAAFVERWEQLPLFASQSALPDEARATLRTQRLSNTPHGLSCSLRGMGAGRQEPLWSRLPALSMPALLIVGSLDTKYCDLARQMVALLPNAQLVIVPDAGHAVHLEQPVAFAAAVDEWRAAHDTPCATGARRGD